MKDLINGHTYNTETGHLVKSVVIVEDLTNGYLRYKTVKLYQAPKMKEWFVGIYKTTVDRCYVVLDEIEYITPVGEDFIYNFRQKAEEVL